MVPGIALISSGPLETRIPNDTQALATHLSYYIQCAGKTYLQNATYSFSFSVFSLHHEYFERRFLFSPFLHSFIFSSFSLFI